ncbi:MAG TPA: hypothetical protein VK852_00675 [Desulfobacterales bacterium]|jgi:hypothetical protein|nr:hypothetical protein [Desulfobacterales bacterium]
MEHIELKPFVWIHPGGGFASRCDLDLFLFGPKALVIATEREGDPEAGISVASGAEILATIVVQKFALDPAALTWIEHYPERAMGRPRVYRLGESYQRVTFRSDGLRLTTPCWEAVDREGTAALITALKAQPPQPVPRPPR